jgi:hypothetical protein
MGKTLRELNILSTHNAADPIAWRQSHPWCVMQDLVEVKLPKGLNILTLQTLSKGDVNSTYLEFKPQRMKKVPCCSSGSPDPVRGISFGGKSPADIATHWPSSE